MDKYYLIKVISVFDINYKYFKFNVKNQLKRNYGHFYWIWFSIILCNFLLNSYILVFISDKDIEGLIKYGSLGLMIGTQATRFMMDMAFVSFIALELIFLSNYFIDKMQWLLKMSSIYEEIQNKHFDKYLMNYSKKLLFYYRIGVFLIDNVDNIICIVLLYLKWDQFIANPLSFMIPVLTSQLCAKIGCPLIIRQIVLMIFFCRMHCFLFNKCNEYFTHLSKKCRKKHLKTCLSFHYKLCESVEEFQTYLRPTFALLTTIWCPICCYIIYSSINNRDQLLIILGDFVCFVFVSFILILSILIAMIDIRAKEGIHSVYGCALKLANKQAIFPVSLSLKILPCFFYSSYLLFSDAIVFK